MIKDKAFKINLFLAKANSQGIGTIRQILCLFSIYNQPGITTQELAKILGIDRRAVVHSTIPLQRKQFLERERCLVKGLGGKGRTKHFLSQYGMELMDEMTAIK